MKRYFLSSIVLALAAFVAIPALAQDKPYSPKPADPGSLIRRAEFARAPITFDYPEVTQRQVVNGDRYDFEVVFDIGFDEFVAEYMEAYHGKKVVMSLEDHAFANVRDPKLFVIGYVQTPDGAQQFTLGNQYLPFRVTFEARPEGGRTVVTIQNSILTLLHSGIMPARVGYKPVDGKEVRFRWN